MGASSTSWQPPPGLIFEIAEAAGVEIKARRPKTPIRCPLHEDHTESAFLSENNVFFCSVCTPDGGWTAKQFSQAVGVDWLSLRPSEFIPAPRRPPTPKPEPTFGAREAAALWQVAYARMRDDDAVEQDRAVWEYLSRRQLSAACEHESVGVLALGMSVPTAVSDWAARGYRIIAPLFDASGSIANVQARTITDAKPKTLFPSGSHASGTLFACTRGREVLRGTWTGSRAVLFAEGLTDHVALTITSPVPVLSAPGTSMSVSGIGPWVRDIDVYIALDWDAAGDGALPAVAKRAHELGATRVRRIDWPCGAKDACQVLDRRGVVGLERFIRNVLGAGMR